MEKVIPLETSMEFISRGRATKKNKKTIKKVIFLLIYFICVGLSVKFGAIAINSGDNKINQEILACEKVKIIVQSGDTVWELQEKITPNADIREMLFMAEKNAGHSLSAIKPGDAIILLKK